MARKQAVLFIIFTTLLSSQLASGEQSRPFTSDRHLASGLKCEDCHGEGKKQPVKGEKCLECHQSLEEVAKRTQDIKPNPHANHITANVDLDCTECHKGHKANVVYCDTCHKGMTFKRASVPEKN